MNMQCIRCESKPAVHEFICADCLYNDYNVAYTKWCEWQALAELAIGMLNSGLTDDSEVQVVTERMRELRGQPPG